jgi:hypothetical protein
VHETGLLRQSVANVVLFLLSMQCHEHIRSSDDNEFELSS